MLPLPSSPPLHCSTPRRSAHDPISHTFRSYCWALCPNPHLQTWPPTRVAPQETPHQLHSPPSRPLEISTIWSRSSTRLPLTLGSLPRVSPLLLLQIFPPSPLGNKCSSPYSVPPFNRASTSLLPSRTSQPKCMTCLLRLPIWTSPRNPQTSPCSRHPSAALPPISGQPLRPLPPPNALA